MSPFFKQSTDVYELLTPRLEIGSKVGKLEEKKPILWKQCNCDSNKLTCDMWKTECAIPELLWWVTIWRRLSCFRMGRIRYDLTWHNYIWKRGSSIILCMSLQKYFLNMRLPIRRRNQGLRPILIYIKSEYIVPCASYLLNQCAPNVSCKV